MTFLHATMYFFVYNINIIGLYRKEKLTSTINELAQKVSDALAAYCGFYMCAVIAFLRNRNPYKTLQLIK